MLELIDRLLEFLRLRIRLDEATRPPAVHERRTPSVGERPRSHGLSRKPKREGIR
jgi:hypothetical protein